MNSRHRKVDLALRAPIVVGVPFVEDVSGDEPESERDAAPARVARNHAPGRLRDPALRHYERTHISAFTRVFALISAFTRVRA